MLLVSLIIGSAALLSWYLGRYMAWVVQPLQMGTRRTRFEQFLQSAVGQGLNSPQNWQNYVKALLIFNTVMFIVGFILLALQPYLPLNPDGKTALSWDLLFHTTVSFVTNTNQQHYAGEQHLSYFSQLFFVCWLQFVSAATGISALAALSRALRGQTDMGNFFQDVARVTFLILLPLSLLLAILLILGEVPMTLEGAAVAHTLEGAIQTIARGPVAAIVAIKQLGTNGGGFFGANSAHPFENPNIYTNLLENIAILLLPMASVWMFGHITQRLRHAGVLFAIMGVLLITQTSLAGYFESKPAPALTALAVSQDVGNLEGKELRLGSSASAWWASATTATSSGSVNAMHDSLNPLTGLIALLNMWLNMIYGGVGVGLLNFFLYIIVAVFIAGMMVGRTPEYLARKVEAPEMQIALLALLLHPLLILGGTALFAATPWGITTVTHTGSHGFSQILYEMTSAAANNGSGFEGLSDNTVAWNVTTGVIMLLGRFLPIMAPLVIAGWLAAKRPSPETAGSLRVDTPLFGIVLLGTVLLVGALMFLPVAVLGPVSEHLTSSHIAP
ncbi:MAG: potassium-transporting ATPase subunit A [Beggiatoa sp. IS2]|nr:MAG: potassium-transporting ATPase subunit A [Beggiatoa sp. IS2]